MNKLVLEKLSWDELLDRLEKAEAVRDRLRNELSASEKELEIRTESHSQAMAKVEDLLVDRDRLLEQSAQREADYALGLQVANKARELAEDGEKIVRHDLRKMLAERDRLRALLEQIALYVAEMARKALEGKPCSTAY